MIIVGPTSNRESDTSSLAITDRDLNEKVELLKQCASKHRGAAEPEIYGYLKYVYEIFLDFQSKGVAEQVAQRVVDLKRLPLKNRTDLFQVLIQASAASEDDNEKIRWVNALRYVYGWLQPASRLEWCFGVSGGVAGCAAQFSFLRSKERERMLQSCATDL